MNNTVQATNCVKVGGIIRQEIKYSHTSNASGQKAYLNRKKFYETTISSTRLSGEADNIQVILPQILIKGLAKGQYVIVEGELRSRDQKTENGIKREIYVFAIKISQGSRQKSQDINEVTLECYIGRQPNLRKLLSGRTIVDLNVELEQEYGVTYFIHCIAWGRVQSNVLFFPLYISI